MITKLARLVGYTKAPKAMYMARHPVRGAKLLVASKGLKGLVTTRPGAMLGAMVAAPVGGWLALRRRGNHHPTV